MISFGGFSTIDWFRTGGGRGRGSNFVLIFVSLFSIICSFDDEDWHGKAYADGREDNVENSAMKELRERLRVRSIEEQINELGKISSSEKDERFGITRLVYTEEDLLARDYVKRLMIKNGLEVREDAMGTIFGRLSGVVDDYEGFEGVAVGSGSHTDAIPLSGKYDGVYGVLGAIEALGALKRARFQPFRHLEAVMFNSEEPSRFGVSCSGSRAMGGVLNWEKLEKLPDVLNASSSFFDAASKAGYGKQWKDSKTKKQTIRTAEDMIKSSTMLPKDSHYYSFVELHIEQGPELEKENLDIGIVTAIAAPAALEITFEGDGGHAGAQLMPLRNDAVVAGSKLAVAVEEFAKGSGSIDTVATVGGFTVSPNAINSVPRVAVLEIDVRDISLERRDLIVMQIKQKAEEIAKEQNTRVKIHEINKDDPAQSGESAMHAVERATESLGFTKKKMVSRAYHDTLFVAKACSNVAMIFIPCFKGYSHRPDEHSTDSQMIKGIETLALAMAQLSRENSLVRVLKRSSSKLADFDLPFFIKDDAEADADGKSGLNRRSQEL